LTPRMAAGFSRYMSNVAYLVNSGMNSASQI